MTLSQVAGATEGFTQPGTGPSSGPESAAVDKVLETGSTALTPIQTGRDTQSTDGNQKKQPKQVRGTTEPSSVQPWSSTKTSHATSDASKFESGASPDFPAEATTSLAVASGVAGAASSGRSSPGGLQNSGFSQKTRLVTTAITESGFLTSSRLPSPEEGIKDEEVEVTPQVSAEAHPTFAGQTNEHSPREASIKDLEVPQKLLNQEKNEVEEDFGHVSEILKNDTEEMAIAVINVPVETERSSPRPPSSGEEQTHMVDANVWTAPQEKGVPIPSSSDWSPRPPTADSGIHAKIVEATNRASPHAAPHRSKSGPDVRGQRVRPCLHPVQFCPADL